MNTALRRLLLILLHGGCCCTSGADEALTRLSWLAGWEKWAAVRMTVLAWIASNEKGMARRYVASILCDAMQSKGGSFLDDSSR